MIKFLQHIKEKRILVAAVGVPLFFACVMTGLLFPMLSKQLFAVPAKYAALFIQLPQNASYGYCPFHENVTYYLVKGKIQKGSCQLAPEVGWPQQAGWREAKASAVFILYDLGLEKQKTITFEDARKLSLQPGVSPDGYKIMNPYSPDNNRSFNNDDMFAIFSSIFLTPRRYRTRQNIFLFENRQNGSMEIKKATLHLASSPDSFTYPNLIFIGWVIP